MKITDHLLIQNNGKAVPFTSTPNQGGSLTHRFLVMHFTSGSTAAGSISWMCNPAAKASAHLVIARDGSITQLARFDRVTWHAGASNWGGLSGLNKYSIGIELDNAGEMHRQGAKWTSSFGKSYPDSEVMEATHKNQGRSSGWHTYSEAQLEVATEVAALLVQHYNLTEVLGHEDIAPGRKNDPGPAFPMDSFRSKVMGDQQSSDEFYVTTSELNLRAGAGAQHQKIATLPAATHVRVLSRQSIWWEVDVEETIGGDMDLNGWVHSGWLRRVTSVPSVAPGAAAPAAFPVVPPVAAVVAAPSSGNVTINVPNLGYTVPDETDEVLRDVSFANVQAVGANHRQKFATADSGHAQGDPSRCKALFRFPDGTIYVDAKMALCVDGSPRAKQLDRTGLLGTAHSLPNGSPLNAEKVPYVVLPMPDRKAGDSFLSDMGLKKGDLAMVIYNGQRCGAILGELGPVDKIGETSIRVHELLPVPSPWRDGSKNAIRNVSVKENVVYLFFPKTAARIAAKLTAANAESLILEEAEKIFREFEARV